MRILMPCSKEQGSAGRMERENETQRPEYAEGNDRRSGKRTDNRACPHRCGGYSGDPGAHEPGRRRFEVAKGPASVRRHQGVESDGRALVVELPAGSEAV